MAAVLSRNEELVQGLVRNNHLDVNCRDPKTGITSFWLAGYLGEGGIMKILAENGADIYATNNEGVNVLHLSCYLG